MKKFFIILFLLLIIATGFGYSYLKYSSLGEPTNYFNTDLRHKFARYPFWRSALGLHFDGDGKADYLGGRFSRITVEVIMMEGLDINDEALEIFAEKVEAVTGKRTDYEYSKKIPLRPSATVEEIILDGKQKVSLKSRPDRAVVYLVVADRNSADGQAVGSTMGENGIIIFQNMILENWRRGSDEEALNRYTAGVLVHEMGHQLGLDHNSLSGCVMNPEVELGLVARAESIVADFCDFEKEAIKKAIL